jgi:putative RecB family exonuclease
MAGPSNGADMSALAAPSAPEATTPQTEPEIIARLQQMVSPSRLTLFLQCRLKFWFRYVARIAKPKSAALHVGGSAHAVLKAWNKSRWRQEPLTLKQLHDEYATAWADQADEPIEWEKGEEDEEKKVGWRLVETYIRESKIPPELRPDAVEVPVEADLHEHGLPTLIGVLDLVQAGIIVDYKTSGQTPNPERAVHTHEVQTSSYAVLYREATGKREAGIEVHTRNRAAPFHPRGDRAEDRPRSDRRARAPRGGRLCEREGRQRREHRWRIPLLRTWRTALR